MAEHKRFHLRSLDALRQELADLGLELPIDEDLSILGQPLSIGDRELANRFVVQPMEGFDSTDDGTPGPLSFRRYRRYAEGGSALIWFEATAVLQEARSNAHQLCLHRANVEQFGDLVRSTREAAQRVHGRDVTLVIQLTHSGRYSKPGGIPKPMIAHHSQVLDRLHNLDDDYPLVTDEYLDHLQHVYLDAARLAAQAGFDGVDIKSCHRYLVSELLASFTRDGKYGGPLENRARLLVETLGAIARELPEVFVTTRMNVYDAIPYPYGFGVDQSDHTVPDLREPLEVIGRLREIGIPLLNVSIGNPYYNPHYGRPYDRAVAGATPPEEHPLAGVARFIEITAQVQRAFPELPVIASGYTWLRHLMPYVAAGVIRRGDAALIGQGRGAFAYPDSPNDVLNTGRMDPQKTCVTCSGCTQIMRDGTMTGCVVRDREIYAEQYLLGRRYALDHLREQAQRCQDCEFATCTANCPARVDVPAFVRAFAADDIQQAYDVLRRSNVLPEMCAYLCPSEHQCEGGCLEQIFAEKAIPIRDIQMVVTRLARQRGLVGVSVPEKPSPYRVAVVGGGPAGVACAVRLVELGHTVKLFERGGRLGGTPDCMIPDSRYHTADEEVDAVLEPARQRGRFSCQLRTALGEQVNLDDLREQYDAVFLGVGLQRARSLGRADGVVDALEFLRGVKSGKHDRIPLKVAVLGGGNTAMDAAVTAKHLGAGDVYIVYRRSLEQMPAWPAERERALKAGCHLTMLTQPLGYDTDRQGRLVGLRVARTELGEPDASGRRSPKVVDGTESLMPVDMVIEALGQRLPTELREALGDIAFTPSHLIALQGDSQATSLPGVFAGGDLVNGGTTVVQAVAESMRAAEEIDRWLCGKAGEVEETAPPA
jgi:NADPH-dependent glutamate synthase beta subunit-like oxidoreductase/2,4-dienoyl-CoA reductase-like NADH-dependent reductase (Old Yellow Enzyme family)